MRETLTVTTGDNGAPPAQMGANGVVTTDNTDRYQLGLRTGANLVRAMQKFMDPTEAWRAEAIYNLLRGGHEDWRLIAADTLAEGGAM